ncbi:hypothetical protein TrRE_jg786, partial [Triparma retinervis]
MDNTNDDLDSDLTEYELLRQSKMQR